MTVKFLAHPADSLDIIMSVRHSYTLKHRVACFRELIVERGASKSRAAIQK